MEQTFCCGSCSRRKPLSERSGRKKARGNDVCKTCFESEKKYRARVAASRPYSGHRFR